MDVPVSIVFTIFIIIGYLLLFSCYSKAKEFLSYKVHLISSCTLEKLEEYLAEGSLKDLVNNLTEEDGQLLNGIRDCIKGYEKRFALNDQNRAQSQAAKKLSE